MLQNPIHHSTSFAQFCPRVTDSPNLSFESSIASQTLSTHIPAPRSPYISRPLPPKGYNNSKPTISFPPQFKIYSLIALPVRR